MINIVKVDEHYEVFEGKQFLFSADTYEEAIRELEET